MALVALLVGAGAAGLAGYYGAAPIVVLWLAVVVAAWLAVPPQLTGKKDAYGSPGPANPAEERSWATWTMWKQLRWSLVVPGSDWLPGWPLLASWVGAVLVGAICYLWPVRAFPQYHVKMSMGHLADAVTGWWLVVSVASARRSMNGPSRPATRFDHKLPETFMQSPIGMTVAGSAGAVSGALAGIVAKHELSRYHHWAASWAARHPHHVPPPGWAVTAHHTGWYAPLLAVAGALAGIGWAWHQNTTGHWRKVSASAAEWSPRWQSLKIDPPPTLVDHKEVGPATVWTFDAPPGIGAQGMWSQAKKIAPTIGGGIMVAVLERPDNAPGTRHPIRFDVIAWPDLPDFTDPSLDPDVATYAAHSCFAWATEAAGYGRPAPLTVERITGEGSERSAWASRWAWPAGPTLVEIRAIISQLETAFRCEVLLDTKGDVVFFGALDDESIPVDLAKHLGELRTDRSWEDRWSQIQRVKDYPPSVRHETTGTAELADGTEVHRQAFVVRKGIDPEDFKGLEPKLATTLKAAPYVAVCGWPAPDGRPGDRHPQAIVVYWSESTVPTSLDSLEAPADTPGRAAGDAELWVLAGLMNKAFDVAKLARGELVDAREMSSPGQRHHLWEIWLRLYRGVTVQDIRSQAGRVQQALQVPWLRVASTDEADLVAIYAGAPPGTVDLVDGDDGRRLLVALDWGQAWLDSGVVGAGGEPPALADIGVMPHNQAVMVLDFTLPPGVGRPSVKAAKDKLRAATGNAYIEDVDSPLGADAVRLLVSPTVPLPKSAPVNWAAIDTSDALSVPIGTGADGEPVVFDVRTSPHLLVVGATGSGKSTALQTLVYGWLVKGATVVTVDPVKGGADFSFADGYTVRANDMPSALSALRAAYTETTRRKAANTASGVSSWQDLDDPPPPLVVVVDEFTSVIIPSGTPKKTGDPDLDIEIEAVEEENRARTEIGIIVSKLAREARSAGVVVILATQKLAASTLEQIPGKDLKTNLARVLLGQASFGDRTSALRAPQDAPSLTGEIPPGRGLYEPTNKTASIAQFWFAGQPELAKQLRSRVPEGQAMALSALPGTSHDDARQDEAVDIGELDLSLDDLDLVPPPADDFAGAPDNQEIASPLVTSQEDVMAPVLDFVPPEIELASSTSTRVPLDLSMGTAPGSPARTAPASPDSPADWGADGPESPVSSTGGDSLPDGAIWGDDPVHAPPSAADPDDIFPDFPVVATEDDDSLFG